MRALITYLLIPAVFACQGFGAGHSHRGGSVDEPADHALRPHIHLHGGCCHGHRHAHQAVPTSHAHDGHRVVGRSARSPADTKGLIDAPLADHDADAIYLSAVTTVISRGASARQTPANALPLFATAPVVNLASCSASSAKGDPLAHPPPAGAAAPFLSRNIPLLI
jgi:hypothetical protein